MDIVLIILILLIIYAFDGYLRILKLLTHFMSVRNKKNNATQAAKDELSVTILLTVFNEGDNVVDKIADLLKQDYPEEKLTILVASDGSTDNTDKLVHDYKHPQVHLFRPQFRQGKSDTQNQAIATINTDIVLFTDCDTRFKAGFIHEIMKPFRDKSVGCTSGLLLFRNANNSNITSSQSRYWNYELQIRELESQLGILAVATGACMAVRLNLFKAFSKTCGEDCIVPLDTVSQGYQVKHVSSAIAYDKTPETQRTEFKARVRMTLRNWQGTWSRAELLNPLKHPGYAFALWSHKIIRWLTPVWLILLTILSFISALHSLFGLTVFILLMVLYGLAAYGFFAEKHNWKMPRLVNLAYSFMLANVGFLVGLWQAITGRQITIYSG